MKKVMLLSWDTVNDNSAIVKALDKRGYRCITVALNGQDQRASKHYDFFAEYIKDNGFDLVFSVNYFDYLSEACHECGIPYMAWTYDSPIVYDKFETIKYDTTHLFIFDSYEVDKFRGKYGINNVYYLPLASDFERFETNVCSAKDRKKYGAEISFVGSLYPSDISQYLFLLSDYRKGFFNGIIDSGAGVYDASIVETLFYQDLFDWKDEKQFVEEILECYKSEIDSNTDIDIFLEKKVAKLINHSITNRERIILISMLSNHWKFKLYSNSSNVLFKTTKECGIVDYYKEMPKVFKCSSINLNITYKAIKAGIPLRCMDIMGCGGFLLTNYQKDMEEHFVDGRNIAIFHSFDEAYEKTSYYMDHYDERIRIAQNGYETVKKHYSYDGLIDRGLSVVGL